MRNATALIYMISSCGAGYADKPVDSWAPINGMQRNEISNKWVRGMAIPTYTQHTTDNMLKR